ncbi:SH3 domain-containing protein [Brevibacillus formosus]|nr:SH3 domain-containing protein [Brevibacillus formosus]
MKLTQAAERSMKLTQAAERSMKLTQAAERSMKLAQAAEKSMKLSLTVGEAMRFSSDAEKMMRLSSALEEVFRLSLTAEIATRLSSAAEAMIRLSSTVEKVGFIPETPINYVQLGLQSVVKPLNFDYVHSLLSEYNLNYDLASLVYENALIVDEYKEIDTSERQYSKQEIKEIVQEAIQESMIPGALLNIQSLLKSIYEALLKKGNPILTAILIGLLTSIIYDNVVKPTIEYHVKDTVTSTSAPKEAVKEINKETTKKLGVDATFIKGYKFVSAATLQVHERAIHQSKRIHELKLGQVVQVIRSRKDWVLIEWNYSEEVKGRGWVYSRYLKAFK